MLGIKRIIKMLYYHIRFGTKRVKFNKGCDIGGLRACFEGFNSIGAYSFFSGCIGYGSYIGQNCEIKANIGRYCSISNYVRVIIGNHPTDKFVSTHPCFFSNRKQAGFTYVKENKYEEISLTKDGYHVTIGNDVWIGSDVLLLGGITIGDGAIIAAGAVVTKDVEPYTVVAGVPAKVIKKRFGDEEIIQLLKIKWWNKSKDWIREKADVFEDIDNFIRDFGF